MNRLARQRFCPRILGFRDAPDDCSNTLDQSKVEQQNYIRVAKIESIIINISLKEFNRFNFSYSKHCTEFKGEWDLFNDMVTAATETAKAFSTLKVVKILYHKRQWLQMNTQDRVSGAKMRISDDGEWDWGDDGESCSDDDEFSSQEVSPTDSESSESELE